MRPRRISLDGNQSFKGESAMRRSSVGTAVFAALLPIAVFASSHREAPNIARFPTVDSTDFYMFMSYDPAQKGYVTILADYLPLQDAYGGPNYFALDEAALYEIHIDNDGDAREDLTFQFKFDNDIANNGRGLPLAIGPVGDQVKVAVPLKNIGKISATDSSALNFRESYSLKLVRGDRSRGPETELMNQSNGTYRFGKPYDFVGNNTFGSPQAYERYARRFIHEVDLPNCSYPARVFVGQRDEPFVVNLGEIFDLVNLVPIDASGFPGGIVQDRRNDDIRFKNITTLALEVHADCLKGAGNGVIGGWTSASLRQSPLPNPRSTFEFPEANGREYMQVSRLGMPLVNEVVIGLPDKDRFSSSEPKDDGQFITYVRRPTLPALISSLFLKPVNDTLGLNLTDLAPNNFPRADLEAAFLTGLKGVNQLARVTKAEMLRLNTKIAPVAAEAQKPLGLAAGDSAGFPNGRRPGDDVVDIELRVAMGALCHLPLNLCKPENAPVGNAPITDGAPISAADFDTSFPYLRTPIAGSPN
jgi:Domain of unknown function (DUF4331)